MGFILNYICLIFNFQFLVFTTHGASTKPVNVTLKAGIFIGEKENVEFSGVFKPVQRFLGIPYASPPVGERRFARPEPPGVLPIPYNATYHRPQCLQTVPLYYKHMKEFVRSEDCLYLNVYVPGDRILPTSKFPVMVYIHGGSFAIGGADIYSGDKLSTFNDVIVVTINYRLGVFGFLSNGTKSSGNFGLWDMKLSLEWVHKNIAAFGGDPNRVTLFGNSAGGVAVTFMAIHVGNRGLFQRVIAQSGVITAFWAFQKEPLNQYLRYIKENNCEFNDYDEVISCLRAKPAKDLRVNTFSFSPTVDHDFFPKEPAKLFKRTSAASKDASDFFAEIDMLNGVTNKDGALAYEIWESVLGLDSLNDGLTREQFKRLVSLSLQREGYNSSILMEAILYKYTDWSKPDDPHTVRSKLVDFRSDKSFLVPAIETSLIHKRVMTETHKSKNYFYVFDHKPGFVPEPLWLNGSTHSMEVAYVFGLHESFERKLVDDLGGSDPFIVSEEDIKLSRTLMIMWSNFAKSG